MYLHKRKTNTAHNLSILCTQHHTVYRVCCCIHTHTHAYMHTHTALTTTVQVKHHTHTHTHTVSTTTQCKSNTTHTHITVRAHREDAHTHTQGILHTITTTYNKPHKTCSVVCVHIQWDQVKMSTSASFRGSRPSWILIGAGHRVAKSSNRFHLGLNW